jgi:hypothetical protein
LIRQITPDTDLALIRFELSEKAEALQTEVDILRTALQPFADIPEAGVATATHYWCVIGSPSKSHFTREDLRRAKAAINPPTPTEPA